MEIVCKTVAELTSEEYQACDRANYGYDGFMQQTLRDFRAARLCDPTQAIAVMLWDDKATGLSRLVGWALLTPTTMRGMLAVTTYTKRKSKYTVQFWVKRQHRRKGYGKRLMTAVKSIDPVPHVLPHDNPSSEFLSSYHVSVLQGDRMWLKPKRKVA